MGLGKDARGQHGAQQGGGRARHRVRAALQRPVGVQQPRHHQRVAFARELHEPREPRVEQHAVGVQPHGHVVARTRQTSVVRRAEAWVAVEHDDVGARVARDARAVIGRA